MLFSKDGFCHVKCLYDSFFFEVVLLAVGAATITQPAVVLWIMYYES